MPRAECGQRQRVRFGLASRGPLAAGGVAAAAVERCRCVASAEAIARAPRAKGASRCAAEGTRSRSTHRQLIASRVGRESAAGERPRSRDAMREQAEASLPVGVWPTGKVGGEIRRMKEAHAPRTSSTLGGSQAFYEGMRRDVRRLRPGGFQWAALAPLGGRYQPP